MLNPAAIMIHHKENDQIVEETTIEESKSSFSYKRFLPNAPGSESLDKPMSLDDTQVPKDSGIGIRKFKYYTTKKKKEKRSQTGASTATFYVSNDSNIPCEAEENFGNKTKLKKDLKVTDKVNDIPESQTHVALYKFFARHKDELSFKDGDPIQVLKVNDDLWYEGINLLTGKQGIFPCRYVADILQKEELSGMYHL